MIRVVVAVAANTSVQRRCEALYRVSQLLFCDEGLTRETEFCLIAII